VLASRPNGVPHLLKARIRGLLLSVVVFKAGRETPVWSRQVPLHTEFRPIHTAAKRIVVLNDAVYHQSFLSVLDSNKVSGIDTKFFVFLAPNLGIEGTGRNWNQQHSGLFVGLRSIGNIFWHRGIPYF